MGISQFNPDMNYFFLLTLAGSTEVLFKEKNESIDSKSFPVGVINSLREKGFLKEWSYC
ncbi:MAG: hypothetical protein CM15mP109_08840 [Candidatus Dadabacteria bacterium]|nr:MAG: hypothetical protein CM15mP109_08840 [Candidatus Dadabacteria bacterium]